MSSDMNVDTPVKKGEKGSGSGGGAGGGGGQEKTLKVHPLAIIGISDHHTRVLTGGSALPPTSPVVGLLFGYQDGLTISILDAEEMEPFLPHESDAARAAHLETIQTKITLHQKVFPKHEVIGWYRVASPDGQGEEDDEEEDGEVLPTAEDLRMNGNEMKAYNESPLFVLMNAAASSSSTTTTNKDKDDKKRSGGEEAREKLDRDERLPLAIYETLVTVDEEKKQRTPVFVNLEFELETSEPERIAVEKVFKTQPATTTTTAAATTTTAMTKEEEDVVMAMDESKDPEMTTTTTTTTTEEKTKTTTTTLSEPTTTTTTTTQMAPSSQLDMNLLNITSTINSLNVRIAILLDFLRKTQNKEIPPNHSLLRQVQGLVKQLPFVMGDSVAVVSSSSSSGGGEFKEEFNKEYKEMMMLSYLASVAKAAKSVCVYTDKFKIVSESSGGGGGGGGSREMRRGF